MYMILIMSMMIFSMSLILMILAIMMSKKTINDREKLSPFECGFNPKNNTRMPFSLQFFMIAIIFLIFDIEIALIIPFVSIIKSINMTHMLVSINMFILILLVGLMHEWNQKSLDWKF